MAHIMIAILRSKILEIDGADLVTILITKLVEIILTAPILLSIVTNKLLEIGGTDLVIYSNK